MMDFKKLRAQSNNPCYQAEQKKKQEERDAITLAEDNRINAAIDVCDEHYEVLPDRDRRFFSSARIQFRGTHYLSDAQKKWLFDISGRFAAK